MKKVFWSASIWLVNRDKTQTDTDHAQLSMLIWILDVEKVHNNLYSSLYLRFPNTGIFNDYSSWNPFYYPHVFSILLTVISFWHYFILSLLLSMYF